MNLTTFLDIYLIIRLRHVYTMAHQMAILQECMLKGCTVDHSKEINVWSKWRGEAGCQYIAQYQYSFIIQHQPIAIHALASPCPICPTCPGPCQTLENCMEFHKIDNHLKIKQLITKCVETQLKEAPGGRQGARKSTVCCLRLRLRCDYYQSSNEYNFFFLTSSLQRVICI